MKRILFATLLVMSLFAAPAASASASAITEQSADLAIQQPEYVDGEVTESKTNGTAVYTVHDGNVQLKPQNFGDGEIVGFGVETEGATMSYDEGLDVFSFSTEHTGTFQLYWEVEQQRTVTENNSTTTQTVRERYVAVIDVEQNQAYDHVQAGSLEEQEAAAENWSAFAGEVRNIFGDDVNMELRTEQAVNLLRLSENPLAALSGTFTSILLTLFITLGGLLVLAMFGGWHLYTRWSDIKYINRNESLASDEQDIDEKMANLQNEERQKILQNTDWNDLLEDDYLARAMRDTLGETVYDGTAKLQELTLPVNLVRDRLAIMGVNGWTGVVERNEDGDVVDADLVKETAVADDAETVSLTDVSDEYVDALDWSHPNLRSFDLANADTGHVDLDEGDRPDVELEGLDLEELMERLEVQQHDFESADVWGEYLLEFVEDVRESDYTDEFGSPDATRYVLNSWLQTAQLERDVFQVPLLDYLGEAIEHALAERDPVANAEQTVSEIEAGKGS